MRGARVGCEGVSGDYMRGAWVGCEGVGGECTGRV